MTGEKGAVHALASNIKALWTDGGALRLLRKGMGLGDTLGVLPPENGGTGTTAGVESGKVVASATIALTTDSSSWLGSIRTEPTFENTADGRLGVTGRKVTSLQDGPVLISLTGDLMPTWATEGSFVSFTARGDNGNSLNAKIAAPANMMGSAAFYVGTSNGTQITPSSAPSGMTTHVGAQMRFGPISNSSNVTNSYGPILVTMRKGDWLEFPDIGYRNDSEGGSKHTFKMYLTMIPL